MAVRFRKICNTLPEVSQPLIRILIVAGSRRACTRPIRRFVYGLLDSYNAKHPDCIFVSGAAWSGPDRFVIDWAAERGYSDRVKKFPADWDQYPRVAGFMRNEEMAKYSNELLLIWDRKSNGSKDMLERAVKHKLTVYEFIVEC